MGRTWLFHPDNGGIFLDWIHPVEVLVQGCGAELSTVEHAQAYNLEPAYTEEHATAVEAHYQITGALFQDDATATIRVGKGLNPEIGDRKTMRFHLEDGTQLDFSYAGTEIEVSTDRRGAWHLESNKGENIRRSPQGPIPYAFLIDDVLKMIEDTHTHLTPKETQLIYNPVWAVNEALQTQPIHTETDAVNRYVRNALKKTPAPTTHKK